MSRTPGFSACWGGRGGAAGFRARLGKSHVAAPGRRHLAHIHFRSATCGVGGRKHGTPPEVAVSKMVATRSRGCAGLEAGQDDCEGSGTALRAWVRV